MQRFLLASFAAAALAGCSSFPDPMAQRSYGSWLDSYGKPPAQAAAGLSPERVAQLKAEQARLVAQAEAVRVRMAGETDRVRRVEELRELRNIGDDLRPIEHELRWGVAKPAAPTPEPGDAGA